MGRAHLLPSRARLLRAGGVCAAIALCIALAGAGCERTAPAVPEKLRVAWIGLVCEAPIFSAYENGYFKDEGLDVELVKTDWDAMQSGMSFGRFDATHTLVTYLLKPIEQGLNVKMTGGIHKGCLRIQAGIHTNIQSIADLKGKRIAVSTMGSPPMIFANRVFAAHGIDGMRDIDWMVFPGPETELALDKGLVDAVACSEPVGSLLLAHGKVRTVVDQVLDAPYSDEFCCVVVVSGKLVERDPASAAKLTRALLRGAKWVGANPLAAAKLSIDRKYLASNYEVNASALSKLKYVPAVDSCRRGIVTQAISMKQAGMLNRTTDPAALAERAWQSLEGVTDEYIRNAPIDLVSGGAAVVTDPQQLAALADGKTCCNKCCVGE